MKLNGLRLKLNVREVQYKNALRTQGFTFIELVFTLTIFSLLVFFSVSSWVYLKQKNEQQMAVDELINAVHYAKMRAFAKGYPLLLSPIDTSMDWSKGIILTQFNNATKKRERLHEWKWYYNSVQVEWHGVANKQHIIISDSAMHSISNGQFVVTDRYTQKAIKLTLNRLGRIKIT